MNITRTRRIAEGVRLSIERGGVEMARAYLYVMHNDLHQRPFGLMEDVFVDEPMRGEGAGTALVQEILRTARQMNCYKLIATSRTLRPRVHALYVRLGFIHHGLEFRMDM